MATSAEREIEEFAAGWELGDLSLDIELFKQMQQRVIERFVATQMELIERDDMLLWPMQNAPGVIKILLSDALPESLHATGKLDQIVDMLTERLEDQEDIEGLKGWREAFLKAASQIDETLADIENQRDK